MEPLGDDLDELRVSQLMESYVVDIYIGTASTFICGLTLFIFCSSFRFLSKNKVSTKEIVTNKLFWRFI
jgi:hypothetical protein